MIGCAKAMIVKNIKSSLEPSTSKCFKFVLLPVSFLSSSINEILGKTTVITFLKENKWIKTGISKSNNPQRTDGYKNVIDHKFMLE
jgi:c-di-GMP-related signal transduction protein